MDVQALIVELREEIDGFVLDENLYSQSTVRTVELLNALASELSRLSVREQQLREYALNVVEYVEAALKAHDEGRREIGPPGDLLLAGLKMMRDEGHDALAASSAAPEGER